MQKYQFVTIDTILAKYYRDFRGVDVVEGDAIEWVGEALGHMRLVQASEEAIAFIEVKNHQADIPKGLHNIIQIARYNKWMPTTKDSCTPQVFVEQLSPNTPESSPVLQNCQGELIGDYEVAYYRPFFDLQYEYMDWLNSSTYADFTPVRLANHVFFNSLVCKLPNEATLYSGCTDEYTIVQDKLRFSFKEGFVAVAYTRQMIDTCTGFPMIPDDESAKAAITYYIGWKIKERECWNHREGACQLAEKAEAKWLKYIKQFKNKAKMPYGADEHQNLLEEAYYLIPNHRKYYGYFGKLGRPENRNYFDPDRRNVFRNYYRGI